MQSSVVRLALLFIWDLCQGLAQFVPLFCRLSCTPSFQISLSVFLFLMTVSTGNYVGMALLTIVYFLVLMALMCVRDFLAWDVRGMNKEPCLGEVF